MLVLAILFTVGAAVMFFLVLFGNGMSDNPSAPFEGASLFLVPLVIAIFFWGMWSGGFHFAQIITR